MPTSQLLPNQFTDKDGRLYTLEFNYQVAREIKKALGINVLELEDGVAFTKLGHSREHQAEIVWRLVEEQCEKTHQISEDDFFRAVGPDQIEAIGDALMAAMVGFSRQSLRPALQAMLDATREAEVETAKQAVQSLKNGPMRDKITTATAKLLKDAEDSIPGD